jgi:hypothetical protein
MLLTKTAIQASLQAAFSDPVTSQKVKEALDQYFTKFPYLGGITAQQEAQQVENFLNSDPATWTIKNLQRVAVWLRDHWEGIAK